MTPSVLETLKSFERHIVSNVSGSIAEIEKAKLLDFEHKTRFFSDAASTLKSSFLLRTTFNPGHATGSAFVVNSDLDRVLLMHHRKLDKWLQPGGHADGQEDLFQVAWRETLEETGVRSNCAVVLSEVGGQVQARKETLIWSAPRSDDSLEEKRGVETPILPNSSLCFDIDLHRIPARLSEPEHYHFDFRFILIADDSLPLVESSESKELRWFSFSEAVRVNPEESIARPLKAIRSLQRYF